MYIYCFIPGRIGFLGTVVFALQFMIANTQGHHMDDLLETHANPRFQSNFVDEDFLGKLKNLGRMCNVKTCMKRLLQRYIIYIVTRWQDNAKRNMFGG